VTLRLCVGLTLGLCVGLILGLCVAGEHLAALERSVLLREGVGHFHLVGHSMGSLLCLALAAKYPHRVRSLTLLAPVYIAPQQGVPVCEVRR
jgi:pimeloyl-ACP methyl ester carboxylesterase